MSLRPPDGEDLAFTLDDRRRAEATTAPLAPAGRGTARHDGLVDLLARLDRPPWYELAACRGLDPDLFFPERGERTDDALAVCAPCPVRDDCLAAGLTERFGIWGGRSERQRRILRRERAGSSHSLNTARSRRVRRARDLRAVGWTVTDIAAELGVSLRVAHRYLEPASDHEAIAIDDEEARTA
jgi:WhiB family redox-sensing transcriptional regulator